MGTHTYVYAHIYTFTHIHAIDQSVRVEIFQRS